MVWSFISVARFPRTVTVNFFFSPPAQMWSCKSFPVPFPLCFSHQYCMTLSINICLSLLSGCNILTAEGKKEGSSFSQQTQQENLGQTSKAAFKTLQRLTRRFPTQNHLFTPQPLHQDLFVFCVFKTSGVQEYGTDRSTNI